MLSVSSIVLGQVVERAYRFNHFDAWRNGKFIGSHSISNKKFTIYKYEEDSYTIEEQVFRGTKTLPEYYYTRLIKKEGDVLYLSGKMKVYDRLGREQDANLEVKIAKTYMEMKTSNMAGEYIKYKYYNK